MNREIRFRAWRKDIKKMIYPGVPVVEEGVGLELIFGDNRYAWVFADPELHLVMGTPQDSELMQYIGLNDKNGVEIYEGDIVEYNPLVCVSKEKGEVHDPVKGVVEYKGSSFTAGYVKGKYTSYLLYALELYKVIGNIYENPELLGEA